MKKKMKAICKALLIRVPLVLTSIVVIIPFLMVVINSFKTNAEFYEDVWALPKSFSFENYIGAFEKSSMATYIMNSVIVSGISVAVLLALAGMISYAIARRGLRWSKKLYNLYLVGLLIPQIVGIIPLFLMARVFNLFDTLTILILSYAAMELPFAVFTLTAFFKTLPGEMEEAASIDGANNWQILLKIIMPLSKPGMITVGIFAFLDFWSEYTRALALLSSESKKTIPLAIMKFKPVSGFKVDWGLLCAACIIFIIPVIIVYAVYQRKLIDGLTAGGVKG